VRVNNLNFLEKYIDDENCIFVESHL